MQLRTAVDVTKLSVLTDSDLAAQIDARFPKPAVATDADMQQASAMLREIAARRDAAAIKGKG